VDLLEIVQRLHRIAQAGLAYSEGPYDRERYEQLHELAAEIAAAPLGEPKERFLEILRAERGYPTPKLDIRAVVPKDGKLLFVRESSDGLWALPGGWADIGDTPGATVVREVLEETGYVARAVKLLALFDKSKHAHPPDVWWVYKVFFLCELEGGSPRTSHETLEIGFFDRHALPPLSTPRNTEAEVLRMFEHLGNPGWQTDFD
jgi:ADP-ribose pyrophosphatase YjhB (NUDIX family)